MEKYKGIDFVFSPSESEKASILILHGICEHSLRYSYLIKYLNNCGFTCAAVDHPGHGKQIEGSSDFARQLESYERTEDKNLLLSSLKEATENSKKNFQTHFHKCSETLKLSEIIEFQKEFLSYLYEEGIFKKGTPLFLLGQSMGGLIAAHLSFAIDKSNYPFSGTVFLSPAFRPIATQQPGFINNIYYKIEETFLNKCWDACMGKSPIFSNIILKLALTINPPIDSGRAGDAISDIELVNDIFKNDPLVGKNISLRFLHSVLISMTQVMQKAGDFSKPYLLLYGSEDQIVNSKGSKEFHDLSQQSSKKFADSKAVCYENYFPHELYNSKKENEVMQIIADWIKALAASGSQSGKSCQQLNDVT